MDHSPHTAASSPPSSSNRSPAVEISRAGRSGRQPAGYAYTIVARAAARSGSAKGADKAVRPIDVQPLPETWRHKQVPYEVGCSVDAQEDQSQTIMTAAEG